MAELERALRDMFDTLDHAKGIPAILGDGAGNVAHPRIENHVWIQLLTDPATGNVKLATAYNAVVPERHGILVYVKPSRRRGRRPYEIVGPYGQELYPGRDWAYDGAGPHALMHLWPDGADIISINPRQIIGLRAREQDTPDMTLQVDAGWYDREGFKEFAGGNSPAFTDPAPNWRWDLLVIDTGDALAIETGTPGTYETVTVPTPSAGVVPICAVLLGPGQTSITETCIYPDLRFVPHSEGGSLPDHDHSGDPGDGGQLDWDDIWLDAVHDHSAAGEGGQLDWDLIWADAVHDHTVAGEGGQLDHGAALTGASLLDDDHPQYIKDSEFTAKGDILVGTGAGTFSAQGVGADDEVLVAAAAEADGVKWAAVSTLSDAGVHIHAYKENKSAECDGAKVVFITAQQFEDDTLRVMLNGQEQVDGVANDYVEAALLDEFTMAVAPIAGDTLICHYLAAVV
jgi:hypothetical protein